MKTVSILAGLIVGSLLLWTSVADAATEKDRPFKGAATGQVVGGDPAQGIFVITYEGQATHLGRYTAHEELVLNPDGTGQGTITLEAANGDELYVSLNGMIVPPNMVAGTYTFTGGTGRFEDASGEADFEAELGEGGELVVSFDGTIQY